MFPKELRFNIHPRALQSAVERLPEPKGQIRRTASTSEELKNKLLQVPVEKLKLWKMKPKMLSKLPYLVIEKKNKALQERILAIAVASMENCTEDTLVLLLGYLYRKQEFIEALNARFIKAPPQKNAWLRKYYKAFRSEKPASNLALLISTKTDDITELTQFLCIPKTSPFFEAVCIYFAKEYNWAKIKTLSFSSVLSFLSGSAPSKVKQKLLLALLKEYCNQEYSIVVLQTHSPLRAVLQHSLRLFGAFSNPIWKGVPHALRLAKILYIERKMETYLGFGDSFSRLRWWRRWIESIDEIIVHRPSSLICLYLNDIVIVESLAVAQRISIYNRDAFMLQIQPKLWESAPFQISIDGDIVERHAGWQEQMNQWMIRKGFRKGEEW